MLGYLVFREGVVGSGVFVSGESYCVFTWGGFDRVNEGGAVM